MSDLTNTRPQIKASPNADRHVNELFDACSPAMTFGRDARTCDGLTWGWLGGRWNSIAVDDDTHTLGASATTYMVVARATGVVSFATSTTNWNNTTDYWRAYKLVTNASSVVDHEDHRGKTEGVGGGGGGASTTQPGEMISGYIGTPANKTYKLVVKAAHPGVITETTTISESGTCTATWKINTTALAGTVNSVSTTEQSQAHASANSFAAGDDIQLTVSSNASCIGMSFTIKYTRTLAS